MGGAKYVDSKEASSWDEASELLIERCMKPNSKFQGGEDFRRKNIWTLPIDDLFRANIEPLKKIYNMYAKGLKRHLDLDDCIAICANLGNVSQLQITEAYSFSKITIIDEMNHKERYDKMLLVEFLDFICRIADFKYREENNITFLEKVERIIDLLFKQIDAKRRKPNYEI
mmetsp:Transcript_12818/g.12735  ORF Transcript_12818/g.12735 Transcript_12818/m.12735 type:complete len:171 (+) Transcript_12818:988-1500(+)